MLWKVEGYLLIPHELLHVAAYRLIGRRCSYRLGDSYVKHIEHCTVRQYPFCLLFTSFRQYATCFPTPDTLACHLMKALSVISH